MSAGTHRWTRSVPSRSRSVPAVARAFDVLDLFLDEARPLSVPEITAALGLPRSTTHELVHTLVNLSCLEPVEGHPHRFALGLHLFELGSAYASNIDLAEQGQTVARDIVTRSNETVHVAVLDGADVLYLVKADSPQAVRMVSAVGRRLPAHCTAVGKILLAGLPDEEVAARYGDGAWVTLTPNSIPSLKALLQELAEIRERELAFDDCESNIDVRCVAAPVRDRSGAVVAGLSISVPAHRSEGLGGPLADLVREGAAALSRRLGH